MMRSPIPDFVAKPYLSAAKAGNRAPVSFAPQIKVNAPNCAA
jgi:hypothetical protein